MWNFILILICISLFPSFLPSFLPPHPLCFFLPALPPSFIPSYFGHAAWLVGSWFSNQGLNLGHSCESYRSWLGHQRTPNMHFLKADKDEHLFMCFLITCLPFFHTTVPSQLWICAHHLYSSVHFYWGVCLIFASQEFFICSVYKSFIRYISCWCFLLVCGLHFYIFKKVSFKEQKFYVLIKSDESGF